MAQVDRKGSRIMTGLTASPVVLADAGEGGGIVRHWVETVETASDDSANSTYLMAVLPSNARIVHTSRVYWDDLASSGSPTLDFGLFPIRTGDFTGDDDALKADADAATVNITGIMLVADPANLGKQLWQFVNGLTADPKCDMYLKITLKDAAVNIAGTITTCIDYTID
jgi:hypothetical protein